MNLLKLRKSKGLTQCELAKILGFSVTAISQYETGKREPKFETIRKLTKILDCSVDDLLKETN